MAAIYSLGSSAEIWGSDMLRRLRNPGQAAQAVMALKAEPLPPLGFAKLATDLIDHNDRRPLPAATQDWLIAMLKRTSDPIVRHTILSRLIAQRKNTPEIEFAAVSSLLASGDLEMALDAFSKLRKSNASPEAGSDKSDTVGLESDVLHDQLAKLGAISKFSNELTTKQWFLEFQLAVSQDDFRTAVQLWEQRDAYFEIPVSVPLLSRFIEMMGRYQQKSAMQQVLKGVSFDLDADSPLSSAALNCIEDPGQLIALLHDHHESVVPSNDEIVLGDYRHVSDKLAVKLVESLRYFTEAGSQMPTSVGNILLQGVYRNFTSQTVFHVYRTFFKHDMGFSANADTAYLLANAAWRMGNSKLLIHEIWKEHEHLDLRRKFYESFLLITLSGDGCESSKFVLAEMARRNVPVRQHIQRMIYNRFQANNATESLVEIAGANLRTKFHEYDTKLGEEESGNSAQQKQAVSNANAYLQGIRPQSDRWEALEDAILFDERRKEALHRRAERRAMRSR